MTSNPCSTCSFPILNTEGGHPSVCLFCQRDIPDYQLATCDDAIVGLSSPSSDSVVFNEHTINSTVIMNYGVESISANPDTVVHSAIDDGIRLLNGWTVIENNTCATCGSPMMCRETDTVCIQCDSDWLI
jgi:uncharacterized Zn finger protein (UPF0148 family)